MYFCSADLCRLVLALTLLGAGIAAAIEENQAPPAQSEADPEAGAPQLRSRSDPRAQPQFCWPEEALQARPGERAVTEQTGTVKIPDDIAAAYTPPPPQPIGPIRRVDLPPGARKLVALTFDLCEAEFEITGFQGAIFAYLREKGIKATFFAGGKWLLNHPERGQQLMADPLFEIANHAYAHRNLRRLSGETLRDEIRGPQLAHASLRASLAARQCLARDGVPAADRVTARRMTLFRFPFGACNDDSLRAVANEGLRPIQWDVSTGDATQSVEEIMGDIALVKSGSIVLMHANGRGKNTDAALPRIVAALRKKGFDFVTVSELLAAGKPVVTKTCYDLKLGDTDRYDRYDTLYRLQGRDTPLAVEGASRR